MTFASLTLPSAAQRRRRTVETRLSSFGCALRETGTSVHEVFDIVRVQDERIVWVNSSLHEIANLDDSLLGSFLRV
jgi:hypothetical protein